MDKQFVICNDIETAGKLREKLTPISSNNGSYMFINNPAIFEVDESIRSKVAFTNVLTF